ncbi:MAG: tRNA lysidine(34) synthetase TilS, partial [bacterium]
SRSVNNGKVSNGNQDVTENLIDSSLADAGAHVLVAVSGGADSVALLHALHALAERQRWQLTVAHLEHGIRGKDSRDDAAFVRALAGRLNLPCVVGRAKVPQLARQQGVSLEMAAREARYAFLVRTARRVGASLMATAHTANDQVETILLKFLRGAGRGGLSGMAPEAVVSGIRVIRPLLAVTRAQIEAYLRAGKYAWREDETNTDPAFLRNRVRHELLPLLERDYNPGIRQTLQRTQAVLAAEDEWLDDLARKILEECRDTGWIATSPARSNAGRDPGVHSEDEKTISRRLLGSHPLAARRRVIRLWLFGQGVPEEGLAFDAVSRVDRLLGRSAGSGTVELTGGWNVRRHYDDLRVESPEKASTQPVRVKLKAPGKTVIPGWGLTITVTQGPGLVKEKGGEPGTLPARATLNAAVWAKRGLWVRSWKPGDRMIPFGMTGSQKIQDILVNAKIPRSVRQRVPVVECEGEIIWIPGYRIAARWAVANAGDRNLQLAVTGKHNPLVLERGRR